MPLPPELIVTVEKVSADPQDDQFLAVTSRSNGAEVCRNLFHFRPNLLVDFEPQWMLEKAVPRHAGETIKRGPADATRSEDQAQKLAEYGRRLYGLLFGDGAKLAAFLEFNDAYRSQARLTLALHGNAATLWRLPWEYLHDEQDFLALTGRLLLSRVPHGLGRLDPAAAAPPLRILVVVSAPDDQRPLDTEEEIGAIQRALDAATRAGRVEVEYLDDATLPAIGEALRRFRPHVLHYTGHGYYDKAKAASFLALEDDDGCTRLAGITDLRPLLRDDPDLRLALLSGCQTAQTSAVDAFAGVATGLLAEAVPAVLAMQYSILDQSGITLAAAFYAALAEGATPIEAAQRVRIALWQDREGPGYDWGIPALYLRAPEMRLVQTSKVSETFEVSSRRGLLLDVGGLPLPPHFVGRKPELRALRRALADPNVTAAYVRGIGGMGKSSLAAKFLERPGLPPDGVLVIRCNETAALDIPVKLARWLEAQGKAGHTEAAALLLDSRLDPADRTRQAIARIADRRYVLVFDNFESVMAVETEAEAKNSSTSASTLTYTVADLDLAAFFDGLLAARWRGLCLFTGRYRWAALEEHLGRGVAVELHLPELTRAQAIMLMDNLPNLHLQPLEVKIAIRRKVGGHPHSIELLEGWLAADKLTKDAAKLIETLLHDPGLDDLLAEQWQKRFLDALLAQLTAAERDSLTRLCIFETMLDDELLAYAEIKPAWLTHWLDLSLLQREGGDAPIIPPRMQAVWDLLPDVEKRKPAAPAIYMVHPVVREYLSRRMTKDERRRAHEWAADHYGRPFEEEIGRSTWHMGEVLIRKLDRTDDMSQAYAAMSRALALRDHLFAAGDYDEAYTIVSVVVTILARWGERDYARRLLQESIATLEDPSRAVARGRLAEFLQEEGKLAEALAIYEETLRVHESLGQDTYQMAVTLTHISDLYADQGEVDRAMEKAYAAQAIWRDINSERDQAGGLQRLADLYKLKENYGVALALSEEAERLCRKLVSESSLATVLHQRGLILKRLAAIAPTAEEADRQRRAAWDCFTKSLVIRQRIGDEEGVADDYVEMSKFWISAGQMQNAIEAIGEAIETYAKLGSPVKVSSCLDLLGFIHERQGQLVAALEKYQQALELYQQYAPPEVERCKRNIALVREKMGNG